MDAVSSLSMANARDTVLVGGFWSSLPIDYLLRITGTTDLRVSKARSLPAPEPGHPLETALLVRTMRLNCLTRAYEDLWDDLYSEEWRQEQWAVEWPRIASLGVAASEWNTRTPLRTEYERRAALVEVDALVAVWLGLSAEQLCAIYRARFPQLYGYESATWFDAQGAKIAANWNSYGSKQTKGDYERLREHLRAPQKVAAPDGYDEPFYKADREAEYRQAHAVFSERLERAKAEGWTPDGGAPSE